MVAVFGYQILIIILCLSSSCRIMAKPIIFLAQANMVEKTKERRTGSYLGIRLLFKSLLVDLSAIVGSQSQSISLLCTLTEIMPYHHFDFFTSSTLVYLLT